MINNHGLNDINDHHDDHGSLLLTVAPLDDQRLSDIDDHDDDHGSLPLTVAPLDGQ